MELLEEIRIKAGLAFISDISMHLNKRQIKRIMKTIPRERYSEEEWEEAMRYCFGKKNG